jgi:HEPN domain-containing protein
LKTIQLCIDAPDPPCDTCCFHAQQAAEKYLKSYLVAYNIDFPKTHDLIELMNLCKTKNLQFEQLKPFCLKLKNYAITPRYPDMLDDLTVEDAQQAYQNSVIIKDFVLKHFFE